MQFATSVKFKISRLSEYTGILWLPLWGFVFFAEVPPWTTALGALLIVASGIAVLRHPGGAKVNLE